MNDFDVFRLLNFDRFKYMFLAGVI